MTRLIRTAYGDYQLQTIPPGMAIEVPAIIDKKPGDTLSDHVWKFLGVKGYPLPKGYKLRRGALGAFLVWLFVHFLWGV